MFKNPFSLDLYRVNVCDSEFSQYVKIKNKNDKLWSDKSVNKKILPSINLNNNNFIIGDLFFNKTHRELIVFSFLTSTGIGGKHSINKLGFIKFKGVYGMMHKPSFLNSLNEDSFIKFNKMKNIDNYIRFGNLFLDNNVSEKLFELYKDESLSLEKSNSFMINLRDYLKLSNNINVSLFYSDKMINGNIDDINQDLFLSLDFCWQPRLFVSIKSDVAIKELNGIQYNIYCIKDEFKRKTNIHKFFFYFDIDSFETKLMLPDNNTKNLNYLLKSSSLNYDEVRLNDKNYNESLLYFL